MEKLLLIEDDKEMCQLLEEYLDGEGFQVESIQDGKKGLEKALSGRYSLVILDVMLPSMNGFDVLRHLRATSDVPVLMLTARGEDVDRIVGLEMGADDYLKKPFNPRELVARIRAILRRKLKGPSEAPETLAIGDIELDLGAKVARKGGEILNLTTVEFRVLERLVRSAGQVVTRQELTQWALKRRYSPFDRSIDVHVSNLRKKLGPYENGVERIKTLRGEGYLFAYPTEKTED